MKKIALATVLAMFAGSSAFAGNAAPMVSDEPMMVEEDAGSMGGSAGWAIPLIAVAVIAFAVSQSD